MNYLLILISVTLSAVSQVILRYGMTRQAISEAMAAGGVSIAVEIARSPFVILGLGLYGAGAVVWLFVLSRIAVSFAYPFVALGIVLTTMFGAIVLSERISLVSGLGVLTIVAGIALVALGKS